METTMAQAMDTGARSKRRGNARGDIQARGVDVLNDFSAMRKDMSRLAGESASYVSEKVREYPAAAIGLSIGAGLLLGMLLARR